MEFNVDWAGLDHLRQVGLHEAAVLMIAGLPKDTAVLGDQEDPLE